ncbi:RNA 2',3'-cyclic phosphodiesterase [Coralloluteibacterium stylophorae]|uniref:RNA 2',3'-cyclic phosphodiesterase n=1 Tax=Coralloluteibacterium stylophorae TaxID=1776034 RepID=A0A8J8AXI7_9GAMM|nr:RNA 2',3'-cyclic phosphodiesterase [Coralloluteibacterium stylophorae]MBS7455623.1 RNA 2',3'-cyclic phosphodiesterase [Coralloluteibacterium stylophorae]
MSAPAQGSLAGFEPPAATGDTHRLFFALWPDEAVRAALAERAAALRAQNRDRARWVGAHRYHMTLHFLGDRPALDEPVLARASEAVAALDIGAFDLAIDRAGSFGNRSVPWWLGCARTPPALGALHGALGEALLRAGVRLYEPRRLVPHITIARDAQRRLEDLPIPPLVWRVDRFVLIHSVLGAASEYRVVGDWPLRTG